MSVCSRKMDITVILSLRNTHVNRRIQLARRQRYLQGPHEEHDSNSHLLFPMQFKSWHLTKRDEYHPSVEGDTQGAVAPSPNIAIDTVTRQRVVNVLSPCVTDWRALKDGRGNERDTKGDIEKSCCP